MKYDRGSFRTRATAQQNKPPSAAAKMAGQGIPTDNEIIDAFAVMTDKDSEHARAAAWARR